MCKNKINKKYILLISSNIFMLLVIVYLYFDFKKQIWYQNISDRYYYASMIQKDNNFLNHIYKMSAVDIVGIGEDKIDLNGFSTISTSSHLCVGHKYLDKEKLLSSIDKSYKKSLLEGLDKITRYCNEP